MNVATRAPLDLASAQPTGAKNDEESFAALFEASQQDSGGLDEGQIVSGTVVHVGREMVVVDITSVTNGTEQGVQQVSAILTDDDGQLPSSKIALKRNGGTLNTGGNIDHSRFDTAVVTPE